jgi:hypothetical protein
MRVGFFHSLSNPGRAGAKGEDPDRGLGLAPIFRGVTINATGQGRMTDSSLASTAPVRCIPSIEHLVAELLQQARAKFGKTGAARNPSRSYLR